MPAQAVARLFVEEDICPKCGEPCNLIHLVVLVEGLQEGRHQTVEGCFKCLGLGEKMTELKEEIRIKDVMDLQTKARHREVRRKSMKREAEAAHDIGGRQVSGSGSGISKGDARNNEWMVEDKFTTGKSYTLKREVLSKAISQAGNTGRKPVIRVGLSDGTELAICLWSDMKEVIREDDQSSDDQ